MITMRARVVWAGGKVQQKARQGSFRSIGHAAAAIRLTAKRSIRRRKGPSAEGQPPNTHTRRLPQSIVFAAEKQGAGYAIIGASAEIIGQGASPHERGGRFRGQTYPKRPFMRPALDKLRGRLPAFWANSVRD
jgi:hypothetical protein